MAVTLVQSPTPTIVNAASSTAKAFASNVTAGNFIFAGQAIWHSGGTTISTPVDTLLHTYVAARAQKNTASGDQSQRGYYVANISGGADTITFASALGTTDITGIQGEFAGVATSSPLDVTNTGGATSASATTAATAGTAVANSLSIGMITFDGLTATISPTGTVNQTLQENETNSTSAGLGVSYDLDTGAAGTAVTATWTLGASRAYVADVFVFKAAVTTTRPVKMAGEWGGYAGSSGGFAG